MRQARSPFVSFERAVLAGVMLFIGYLLYRYDLCFQDGEILTEILTGDIFDSGERARLLGYLAYILTLETRLALWDLLPPHPSFTPIWILTLVIGPVLLFKFLLLELRS